MAEVKRYGCYDKVVGNRRFYMRVYDNKLIMTTQFLDERDENGFIRSEESVLSFYWDQLAYDAMEDFVKTGEWRHSDDWPREVITAW
jgi:hypothetical protein